MADASVDSRVSEARLLQESAHMNTPDSCIGCGERLQPEDPVYQLARGNVMAGFITPTYTATAAVLAEWHQHFAPPLALQDQYKPYSCSICAKPLGHTADVIYLTQGTRPRPPYARPSRRGYTIPFTAHPQCFREKHASLTLQPTATTFR
jgi:hypothetical protein